jgi:hypothetical protein
MVVGSKEECLELVVPLDVEVAVVVLACVIIGDKQEE